MQPELQGTQDTYLRLPRSHKKFTQSLNASGFNLLTSEIIFGARTSCGECLYQWQKAWPAVTMAWSSDETWACTLMHLTLLQEIGLSAEQLLVWLKKRKPNNLLLVPVLNCDSDAFEEVTFHFPLAQTLEITHILVEMGWCYLLTGKAELRPTKAPGTLPSIIPQHIKESNFRASVRVVRSQQNLLVQCHKFELFFICWMKGFAIFFCREK